MTKDVRPLAGDLGWPVIADRGVILVAVAACNGRATPELYAAVRNQPSQRLEAPEPTVSGLIQRSQRWMTNVDTRSVIGSNLLPSGIRRHDAAGNDTCRHSNRAHIVNRITPGGRSAQLPI